MLKEKRIIVLDKKEENDNKDKATKRKMIWDIVKGIGILSIVIGHVTPSTIIHEFVYTYHLIIFFFITAYFYNEKKYGNKPFEYFAQKLKASWTKYVFYVCILVVLHNLLIKYHLYNPNTIVYEKFSDIIVPLLNSITFNTPELFAGALWFVPVLLISSGLFGGMIYVSKQFATRLCLKIHKNEEPIKKSIKYVFLWIITILYGILGVYLNEKKLELGYHIHTVFLVIPIFTLGYFVNKNTDKMKKIKKWYIMIPTLVISTFFLLYIIKKGMTIDLAIEKIINGYMFYIVSIIGILFCISLADNIEKIPVINKIFAFLGKHSFSIMALHFLCVKVVDVIYSKMIGEVNAEIISKWVTSYPEKIWGIYVIAGCFFPTIISVIIEIIKSKIQLNEESYIDREKFSDDETFIKKVATKIINLEK